MKPSGIIYYHDWDYPSTSLRASPSTSLEAIGPSQQPLEGHALQMASKRAGWTKLVGIGMIALALGGVSAPFIPRLRLESRYYLSHAKSYLQGETLEPQKTAMPAVFNPLKQPDGSVIEPVDKEFSLVIPKIGINAAVIPSVNPTKPGEYSQALKKGIAHSSLSYFPNEDGTVYLFSHSTNYDWFVGDLNAVFYLLKNLEEGDTMVVMYKGTPYTYRLTEKRVVAATAVSYLVPQAGARRLILQTCWPPGSISERLLIFADLVEQSSIQI